ncbi:Type IV secretory pathway, VirB11 component [Archaeoglobus sulfaticallidus PM70-1]|uniref:Type IV secretory pathway, VirB11 component n=1 Tax=Archaeoglobus sulfaticallidus PM70-1 TaxID=387631 RepID=N0BCW8_9EURY|nr:type II/IV secretion system ATPase subunit [Archaeoglobus sulfaticallidus]AGK61454.1 Type IV secretory pathway, VirB11 component [Archaeoglobus sulfaticallidus PM70-1]
MLGLLKRKRKEDDAEESIEEYERQAMESIEEAKKLEKVFKSRRRKKGIIKREIVEAYDPSIHGDLVEFSLPEDWRIVEEYWIQEPFSKAYIIYNDELHDYRYIVVEPELNPVEIEVLNKLKLDLGYILEVTELERGTGKLMKEEILKNAIDSLIEDMRINLDVKSYYKILYYIIRDFIYYNKLTPLMMDRSLEDISCNGYDKPVFVFHRNYANIETNLRFNERELDTLVVKLAQQSGKHISIAEPMIDATLPDGSRIQMTLGREVSDHGSTFTIRKFRDEPVTPIDLIVWKTFSSEQMAYLWLCIENKKSLIFAGGTASGKTTSMNAISLFIPRKAKIVTIEDTRELMLPHENWIPLVTREAFGEKGVIDMYDLLRAALRQRPEYIIVGEVRGKEALTLFQAMATGHTTYSTLHADSVNGAIHRLESPPIEVPRPMLEALDIISIQAQTYVGGKRVRKNIEIAEIVDLDPHTKMLRTSTVFQWDSVKDKQLLVGHSKALEEIRKSRGWSNAELQDELKRRRQVLEFMVEHNIRDFKSVSDIIHAYQSRPDKVLEKMEIV